MMTYEGTKSNLKDIVEWLEGTDTASWEDQLELAEDCVSNLGHMLQPIYRPDLGGDECSPIEDPDSGKMNAALPVAKIMATAIKRRERKLALEAGKAAVAALE